MQIHEIVGMAGVTAIVASYLALQLGKLSPHGLTYSTANAIGAILVLVSLSFSFNAPAVFIEVFWLAISLLGIFRWIKNRSKKRAEC